MEENKNIFISSLVVITPAFLGNFPNNFSTNFYYY